MDQIPSEACRVQVHSKADLFKELSEAGENHQCSEEEIQLFVLWSSYKFDKYLLIIIFLMVMKESIL